MFNDLLEFEIYQLILDLYYIAPNLYDTIRISFRLFYENTENVKCYLENNNEYILL